MKRKAKTLNIGPNILSKLERVSSQTSAMLQTIFKKKLSVVCSRMSIWHPALVQEKLWYEQATSHYLDQWPPRSTTPHGVTMGCNYLPSTIYVHKGKSPPPPPPHTPPHTHTHPPPPTHTHTHTHTRTHTYIYMRKSFVFLILSTYYIMESFNMWETFQMWIFLIEFILRNKGRKTDTPV